MPDVVLVSMPFGPVMAPSIGLSLLQSELARNGIFRRRFDGALLLRCLSSSPPELAARKIS